MLIGVDVGGTFTDLVAYDGGKLHFRKVSTTPDDVTEGIVESIRRLRPDLCGVGILFHGTTVVINTILQRAGASTALITTEGFRDVYEIGRGSRFHPFDMLFPKAAPLVPRRLRLEVRERMNSRGEVVIPLDDESLGRAVAACCDAGVESVAVCFIHGHVNSLHEAAMVERLKASLPDVAVSASHEVVREFREYERISTTVLNVYVKPQTSRYLGTLRKALNGLSFDGRLLLMQSTGGSMAPEVAEVTPLSLMESGPSAGVVGAATIARQMELGKIIAFDMGGTTAKATLIEQYQPKTNRPYYVGGQEAGFPSLLPVINLVEIGTGGGSIAYIDEGGGLKVGPRSAGAVPGPVCYRNGGTKPTVTDADLVLHRLNPANFLGGEIGLDLEGAAQAIEKDIAGPTGLGLHEAALGIVKIVDNNMALMVRQVSIERGHDMRELTLIAFGGAGPTHALAIARQLNIPRVIVPVMPGHFSAYGMLTSDLRHEHVQTSVEELDDVDLGVLKAAFAQLEAPTRETLLSEGATADRIMLERQMELRYRGQEWTLAINADIPLEAGAKEELGRRFHAAHKQTYGFDIESEPIQVVNLRIVGTGAFDHPILPDWMPAEGGAAEPTYRDVYFEETSGFINCRIYRRESLLVGAQVTGPAVIEEQASTTVLHPGDRATVHPQGHLILKVSPHDQD